MADLTLGSKLRAAREIKGVEISVAAEKTKILPQILRELEIDDFHRIAAPIYAKGFLRSYCTYLNIDPIPLINEYMELHNQGQDLKSTTEQKMADKKAKFSIPPLQTFLPKISLKTSTLKPAVIIKIAAGLGAMLLLAILISKCDGKKRDIGQKEPNQIEQIIAEPQDVYLIKPGVVETK
jgi:hypothetical protein